MKINRLFRSAAAMLTLAGLTAAFGATLAGCGSGLLDTEDEKLEPLMSITLDSSSKTLQDVAFGDGVTLTMKVSLANALYAQAFKDLLDEANPTTTNPYDLLDDGYFELSLVDNTGKDVSNLLETKKFYATSKLTQNTSGASGSEFVPAEASFSAQLTVEIAESTEASTGKLVLKSTQATGRTNLKASTAYSFDVIEAAWGFDMPNAGEIIAAYASKAATGISGAAVVSLPTGTRVKEDTPAGTTIGTATMGSDTVTVKTLTAVARKARSIPVLLVSSGSAFSAGNITLSADYLSRPADDSGDLVESISADDVAKIAMPYYGEDFSKATAAGKFSDNSNVTKSIEKGQLKLVDASNGGNKRNTYSTAELGLPTTGDYSYRVEFDLSMTLTTATAVGRGTGQIALVAKTPDNTEGSATDLAPYANGYHVDELNTKYYLASLASTITNKGNWYVSDASFSASTYVDNNGDGSVNANDATLAGNTTVAISNGSYFHYLIEVDVADAPAAYLTITDADGASVLARTALKIPELPDDNNRGIATNLNLLPPASTTTYLDNFVVYSLAK